jgi:hypothetical protein
VQVRSFSFASSSLNDSMSLMKGARARAVHVGREGAADRHAVGARLLLREGPVLRGALLRDGEALQQLRPHHAGLELDQAALRVEVDDAGQLARVDQHAVGGEGLAAHRVPAAGDAHRLLLGPGLREGLAHAVEVLGLRDGEDARRAELRVDVVHQDARRRLRLRGALRERDRGRSRRERRRLQEIAPLQKSILRVPTLEAVFRLVLKLSTLA